MTADEYDDLPREMQMDALPAELFADAKQAILDALESGYVLAQEAKAAYAYDRRGRLSLDAFDGRTYSGSDDVILQLTVRVPNPSQARNKLNSITALEEKINERALSAQRARLESEIALEEARAEQARATAKKKREELATLNK